MKVLKSSFAKIFKRYSSCDLALISVLALLANPERLRGCCTRGSVRDLAFLSVVCVRIGVQRGCVTSAMVRPSQRMSELRDAPVI